jgi:hypothetical protein
MKRSIPPPVQAAILSTLVIVLAAMLLNVHYGLTWMGVHHGWHWLLVVVKTNGKPLRGPWMLWLSFAVLAVAAALLIFSGICYLIVHYAETHGWAILTPTERKTAELAEESADARRWAEDQVRDSRGDDSL